VTAAPGVPVEPAELDGVRAYAWGAALARLHRADPREHGLPLLFAELEGAELEGAELAGAGEPWAADGPLAEAVARLVAALGRLPRDRSVFGVVHGDFELDNLAWEGAVGTAYDFDDAGRCWYAADIAIALRDAAAHRAAFLAGYRSERDLSATEEAGLPLFAAAHAACWLARLPTVLGAGPTPADPPWLDALRGKLLRHADRQRDLIVAAAPG